MHNQIERILVPVQYSEPAMHAASIAVAIARSMDASVTLIHIYVSEKKLRESVTLDQSELAGLTDAKLQDLVTTLVTHTSINEVRNAVDHGLVEFEPTTNSLADEICNYAGTHDIDMIVIGSNGRSNIKELFAGSISHDVVRKSQCPVTVVH
jgi:nucleotide-binding universal stress UspA family protein